MRKINKKNYRFSEITRRIKENLTKKVFSVSFTAFAILNLLILSLDLLIFPPIKLGDVAVRNIEAPRTLVYIDKEETERIKNLLLSQFKPIYKIDQNIILNILDSLDKILSEQTGISSASKKYLSSINKQKLNLIQRRIEVWLSDIYAKGITQEDVIKKKRDFANFLKKEFSFPSYIAEELSNLLITPNMFIDEKETEAKKQELLRSIRPVEKLISKGDIIIKKGEIVDDKKYKILEAFGLTTSIRNILKLISLFGLVLILQIFQKLFLPKFIQDLDINTFLLSQFLFSLGLFLIKLFSIFATYITPISTVFMLSMSFLNVSYTIFLGTQLSVIFGLLTSSLSFSVLSLINLLTISYFLREIEDRIRFFTISLYLVLGNILIVLFNNYIIGEYIQLSDIINIIINPILSSILTVGIIPFIESIFRLATPIRLLELSNPNHPLLHKLFIEAPGTYYHSLIVANLAERAAEEIGANLYLVRTASLYHDIGKIKRPQYFIENLMPNEENPHNYLSPYISALIIKNHPRDGVKIASGYKFPKNILDIIEQHHGTSVITYFYNKQAEQENKCLCEEDFRYPGPKPKSKEAAIVMLADSIEAATRNISSDFTPELIEKIVRRIISEKINDGQLENTNLTLKELEKISQAFIKSIIRMRHRRIPYPHEIKVVKK